MDPHSDSDCDDVPDFDEEAFRQEWGLDDVCPGEVLSYEQLVDVEDREDLWLAKCADRINSLSRSMRRRVMDSLCNIAELRMIHKIAERGWWSEVVEVVVWMYTSEAEGKASLKRDAATFRYDHRAKWFLFGKDECQIGKTLVVAVMVVVARDSRTACFILTNLRIHVDDVAAKTRQFLQTGFTGHWVPSGYYVEALGGRQSEARLQNLASVVMYTGTIITSYRSRSQLDTLAALRMRLWYDSGSHTTSHLPFIGGDEWDLTKASVAEQTVMERARSAVLGQTEGQVYSPNKWRVICPLYEYSDFHLPEPLAVIAMTSTPEGFLMDLGERGLQLAGWCAPKRYANYMGMEAWRVHQYEQADVTKANAYMAPVCKELVLQHTAKGKNQIGAVGNPYVQAHCQGVIAQYLELQHSCREAGHTLAGLVVSSSGHWFWDGAGYETADDFEDLKKPSPTRLDRSSNPAESLNIARTLCGNTSLFFGGTTASASRSLSYISEAGGVTFPMTMCVVYTSNGQTVEQTTQAAQRPHQSTRDIFQAHGLLDAHGNPKIDVVISSRDYKGLIARRKWFAAVYETYASTGDLQTALSEGRQGSEDFLTAFRQGIVGCKRKRPLTAADLPHFVPVVRPLTSGCRSHGSTGQHSRHLRLLRAMVDIADEDGLLSRRHLAQRCPDLVQALHDAYTYRLGAKGLIEYVDHKGTYRVTAAGREMVRQHE